MQQRCFNEKNPGYYLYGGRGITVCDRWCESFENFLADMGRRPTRRHSIDRIDVNGNYEGSNCRWATPRQQVLNRRPGRNAVTDGQCKHGHVVTVENAYWRRKTPKCRECRRQSAARCAAKRATLQPR